MPTWCFLMVMSICSQVESPLAVEAVLGEAPFSVTDEKVTILELRAHAISGLTLSLQPSPGNSHTMVAKATGLQTLTTPKQVCWGEVRRDAHDNYLAQINWQILYAQELVCWTIIDVGLYWWLNPLEESKFRVFRGCKWPTFQCIASSSESNWWHMS